MNYLHSFRSGLKENQSKQILALISREKDRGSITTIEEFKKRLQELTAFLLDEQIKPTLTLFLGKSQDIIDSTSYNFMMDRIKDDLNTSFLELNTIDEVLAAHEQIINNVVLKNLELAVNELESKITGLEFINSNNLGFNDSVVNNFNTLTTTELINNRPAVFIDPKTKAVSSNSNYAAQLDIIGEKLILGSRIQSAVTISKIRQVFDNEAVASDKEVNYPDSDINNIVDNTLGTYWVYNTMLSQPPNEGVITKLELSLSTSQTINYLELLPIAENTIELIGIGILDANNQFQSILTQAVPVKTVNKFYFNSITAQKVYLSFRNKNYSYSQYVEVEHTPFNVIQNDLTVNSNSEIIGLQIVSDQVADVRILDTLQVSNPEISQAFYSYLIGFDNINVGFNQFKEFSFFISPSKTIRNLGQLGLYSTEKLAMGSINSVNTEYVESPQDPTAYLHGNIEYYLIKKDFDINNKLIDSNTIPLLPINKAQIFYERLLLNEKAAPTDVFPSVGTLQFFTLNNGYHSVDNPQGSIKVYRNGELLESANPTLGPNATLETDGWTTHSYINTPLQKMEVKIKIQNPGVKHIYTVSYEPALSTIDTVEETQTFNQYTGIGSSVVDLIGKLNTILSKNRFLKFFNITNGKKISYSVVNLIIVLRRNSANLNLTPVVDSYLMVTGERNE